MVGINDIKIGRDNMALTVFVPTDCISNCAFCTTKSMYKDMDINEKETLKKIKEVLIDFPDIKELVFTGGEPTLALNFMRKAIDCARSLRPDLFVYINTEYKINMTNFRNFCKEMMIDGVSISHHQNLISLNRKHEYRLLSKMTSVRLNHIMNRNTDKLIESRDIADLYNDCGVYLNVREDYRKLRLETFKDLKLDYYETDVHECDVCHTISYQTGDGVEFTYHKGLATSSIEKDGKLIINDIIVHPDGKLYSDWNDEEFKYSKLQGKKANVQIFDEFRPRVVESRTVEVPSSCGVKGRC